MVNCRNEVPRNGLGNARFNTAKPGDEQIGLKEHVERVMEGQNDTFTTVEHRVVPPAVRGGSRAEERGQIHAVLKSFFKPAFSPVCIVSLHCFLNLCVERTLDATCALVSHVAQH